MRLSAKQPTLRFKEPIMRDETNTPFTESWFASGQRLGYDPRTRTIDPASPLSLLNRGTDGSRGSHLAPRPKLTAHSFSTAAFSSTGTRTRGLPRPFSGQIPFVVGVATKVREHRQSAREQRLSKRGLTIVRLPGGHLTTNERPEALARLISDFTARVETSSLSSKA